jgi:trehalose 6-phosphate phosphatase
MERVAAHLGDTFRVQTGHCVVEITPTDHDKGRAIGALMQHPIFAGREALYLGDDACDEAGFEAVNALGGVSVRVGHDPLTTSARYRLPDPRAVRRWLQALAGQRNG